MPVQEIKSTEELRAGITYYHYPVGSIEEAEQDTKGKNGFVLKSKVINGYTLFIEKREQDAAMQTRK